MTNSRKGASRDRSSASLAGLIAGPLFGHDSNHLSMSTVPLRDSMRVILGGHWCAPLQATLARCERCLLLAEFVKLHQRRFVLNTKFFPVELAFTAFGDLRLRLCRVGGRVRLASPGAWRGESWKTSVPPCSSRTEAAPATYVICSCRRAT